MELDAETTSSILSSLQRLHTNSSIITSTDDIKYLRNVCAKGLSVQNFISSFPEIIPTIQHLILTLNDDKSKFLWQFIANLCVQNEDTQSFIFNNLGEFIMTSCLEQRIDETTNIKLMILYNIHNGDSSVFSDSTAFSFITKVWSRIIEQQNDFNLEFLHLFFEHFLVNYHWTVKSYAALPSDQKTVVLKYILSYLQNNSPNGPIKSLFLQHISKEFKIKSDCILKTVASYVENVNCVEVLSLLKVIASATGTDLYSEIYTKDHSLYLNVGSMLKFLNEISSRMGGIFAPMNKLEQVAPNSNICHDFEKEMSFELKTLLVRTLANLSYNNRKNQEYAREMDFIRAVLNCTQVDARNPLMKEWSIVAVRNLCDGCFENQEFIKSLTKVGDASNDLLKELNLEMGSLRIGN